MLGKQEEGRVEKVTFDKHINGWGILGISFWCCSLSAVKNYFIKLSYWLIYPSPPPLWCNSSKSKNKIVNKCFEFIFFSILFYLILYDWFCWNTLNVNYLYIELLTQVLFWWNLQTWMDSRCSIVLSDLSLHSFGVKSFSSFGWSFSLLK